MADVAANWCCHCKKWVMFNWERLRWNGWFGIAAERWRWMCKECAKTACGTWMSCKDPVVLVGDGWQNGWQVMVCKVIRWGGVSGWPVCGGWKRWCAEKKEADWMMWWNDVKRCWREVAKMWQCGEDEKSEKCVQWDGWWVCCCCGFC